MNAKFHWHYISVWSIVRIYSKISHQLNLFYPKKLYSYLHITVFICQVLSFFAVLCSCSTFVYICCTFVILFELPTFSENTLCYFNFIEKNLKEI